MSSLAAPWFTPPARCRRCRTTASSTTPSSLSGKTLKLNLLSGEVFTFITNRANLSINFSLDATLLSEFSNFIQVFLSLCLMHCIKTCLDKDRCLALSLNLKFSWYPKASSIILNVLLTAYKYDYKIYCF